MAIVYHATRISLNVKTRRAKLVKTFAREKTFFVLFTNKIGNHIWPHNNTCAAFRAAVPPKKKIKEKRFVSTTLRWCCERHLEGAEEKRKNQLLKNSWKLYLCFVKTVAPSRVRTRQAFLKREIYAGAWIFVVSRHKRISRVCVCGCMSECVLGRGSVDRRETTF